MNDFADSADIGVSDITGEKNEGEAFPEKISPEILRDAGGESVGDPSDDVKTDEETSGNPSGSAPEEEKDEAEKEFEALIKGRYKDAYRKRTERILKKRLAAFRRSVKESEGKNADTFLNGNGRKEEDDAVKPENNGATENVSSDCPILTEVPEINGESVDPGQKTQFDADAEKAKNRARPRENGVGGSIGVVTSINVDALDGNGVLALIKRAGAGEKITFGHS